MLRAPFSERLTLFEKGCSACGWRVSLLCSSRVACKKERGRSHFTNALLSNDACSLDVPAVQNPNGMASTIYESSRGCIWRRVESAVQVRNLEHYLESVGFYVRFIRDSSPFVFIG